MTNRQWLIWQLIDMPDEEFTDRVCGSNLWTCNDCIKNTTNNYGWCQGCQKNFSEWLNQERKSNSFNLVKTS